MGWGNPEPQAIEKAKEKVNTVLVFFEGLLDDRPFFGSNNVTFAECVAGTVVPLLSWQIGVAIDGYPKIQAWCDRLIRKLNSQKQTWRLSHQEDKNFSNNLKPDEQINSPALALFPSYFRLHPTSHRSYGAAGRPIELRSN